MHHCTINSLPVLVLRCSLFLEFVCVLAVFRPPLIMQSPPPDVPPGAAPDLLLTSADRKKKQKEMSREENEQVDKNALYGIVSSPSKDSARLTLKLSRVKSPDVDQSHISSDHEIDLMNNNNNQLSRSAQDLSNKLGAEEQASCQQVPVRPNTKDSGVVSGLVFDDAEIETLAEIERIERETASERERWSKEVQDKGIVCLPLPCASVQLLS